MMITIEEMMREDERRRRAMSTPYDPVAGNMSPGSRFEINIPELEPATLRIPMEMQETAEVRALMTGRALTDVFPGSLENARRRWHELRCRYDFPYLSY